MPLHLDYRPQTLNEIFGNESLKASLDSILTRKDRPSSYLITGPSGCGKTTLARVIAKALGCSDRDYMELDISDARGIEDAREIKRNLHYAPFHGKIKVYCLDECHKANDFFQDAMLKALEEPPKHVAFILCTTDPHKLKTTVKRRCHNFEVKRLSDTDMNSFLLSTLAKEGIESGYPQNVLNEIIKSSGGSLGIALNYLDQIIDMQDEAQIMQVIRKIETPEASTIKFCQTLLSNNWINCKIQISLLPNKANLEEIRQAVLTYMRKVLLGDRPDPQAARVIHAFRLPFHDSGLAGLTYASYIAVTRMNLDMPY